MSVLVMEIHCIYKWQALLLVETKVGTRCIEGYQGILRYPWMEDAMNGIQHEEQREIAWGVSFNARSAILVAATSMAAAPQGLMYIVDDFHRSYSDRLCSVYP